MHSSTFVEEISVRSSMKATKSSRSMHAPDLPSPLDYFSPSHAERSGPPPPQIPPSSHFPSPLTDANDSTLPEGRPFLTLPFEDSNARLSDSIASANIPRKPVPSSASVQEVEVSDDASQNPFPAPSTTSESEGGGTVKEAVARAEDAVKPLWRVWWLELACLLLSVFLFVAIVIILQQLDQRDLPDWPLGITLNTLLAFLTTVTTAALTIPVSTAISQTQWVWFSQGKPKPLYDLHVFDQAGREALGSLVLLWRLRLLRHFVVLGALLVAISAVTSPVTQLSINYPVRATPVTGDHDEAHTWTIYDLNGARDLLQMGTGKAVSLATLLDSSRFSKPISYSTAATGRGAFCTTGNCTFPQYRSIGVCMRMANITSSLRVEELDSAEIFGMDMNTTTIVSDEFPKAWNASLPGGFSFTHQTQMGVFTGMLNGNRTVALQNDANLQKVRLASFLLIYTTPTVYDSKPNPNGLGDMLTIREFRHEAAEVFFPLCVQTYETEVRMGVETTKVVNTLTEPASGAQDGRPFLDMNCGSPLGAYSRECYERTSRWNETLAFRRNASDPALMGPQATDVIKADYSAMEDMARTLKWALTAISYSEFNETHSSSSRFASDIATEFGRELYLTVFFSPQTVVDPERRKTCLTNIYTNIATACSASLRPAREADELSPGNSFVRNIHGVNGTAWKEVSYVKISWGWISMLAVELVVAVIFVGLMIGSQISDRESQGESLRFRDAKNSSLATLVVLGSDCRTAAGGRLRPVDGLQKVAKGLKVRLEGGRIVAAGDSETRL